MEKNLMKKIVEASGISVGELILVQFWGEDKDINIMHDAADAVAALGASPVEKQQSRSINTRRFTEVADGAYDENYFRYMSSFDAVIDIFSYRPVVLNSTPEGFQVEAYRKYMGNMFDTLSKVKRFTQIRVPTEENAQESNLPNEEYQSRMLSAMDINYNALRQTCENAVAKLQDKTEIVLTTGVNYELHFDCTGRKWYIDAGDGDIPAGEIYIAPLETETNGTVYFETLYAGCWGTFKAITMTIEAGIITMTNNSVFNEQLAKLDTASKTVCELAFGQNPSVTDLCGYTLLDEKAKGTFHIGIGNNTMFGGENDVPFHMDYVGLGTIR